MVMHRVSQRQTEAIPDDSARQVLIARKLRPPALRDQIVTRSRLLERLRAGADRRITLIACPAGFGKTTLLAAWRETELVHQPVAWLTLDERDNDPAVLWSYVIAALQRACPALRNPRVSGLAPATQGLDMVLPLLINEMCQLDAVTLILDDCHCLSSQAASDTLGWSPGALDQVRAALAARGAAGTR